MKYVYVFVDYSPTAFWAPITASTVVSYRIVQNFGKVTLWRIGRFKILARKTLANTQIGHGNYNFGKIQ